MVLVDPQPIVADVVVLGTRNGGRIAGLDFRFDELVQYDLSTNTASIYRPGTTSSLGLSTNIDALDFIGDEYLISTRRSERKDDGTFYFDRDITFYNPDTNERSEAYRFNNNISGVDQLANGNLLLASTLDTVIGGQAYSVGDVVEYNPITDTAEIFFSHEIFLTAAEGGRFVASANIDALQLLDNGNLLLSTTNTAEIGNDPTTAFRLQSDSVYEYNFETGEVSTYFDGSVFESNSDLKAFSILPFTTVATAVPEPTIFGVTLFAFLLGVSRRRR